MFSMTKSRELDEVQSRRHYGEDVKFYLSYVRFDSARFGYIRFLHFITTIKKII